MIRAALLLAFVAATAAAEPVVIRDDTGGNIGRYIERRADLARGGPVRIEGACLSACTIFTTLANACVAPDARIGFHGASRVPFVQRYADMRMGRYFRGEVRRLYLAEWRHLRGAGNLHVVTGRELARLDPLIQLCRRR